MKIEQINVNAFKDALGISESGNKYTAVYPRDASCSQAKALGKYQFIPARIRDLSNYFDIDTPTNCEFLGSPEMQEKFFMFHLIKILDFINKNKLEASIGKPVKGANKYPYETKINIYGLLAGAHLGGEVGLLNYIWYGKDPHDAVGTYISDYVAKFSAKVKDISDLKKTDDIAAIALPIIAYYFLG